ncbi:restriction endonuclease [Novosphingobium sp. HK4-1]|uniref:Restriction endonuclease n=1 Tax=Novosphingobium mangrovi (ex Huang et al. 2023) TaxID=2976432 RepID=A0ABT2I753_9SPHN|nr:restriction endonuclease [Novosphingobium mangrovi (ex Huang et al. 2023)]
MTPTATSIPSTGASFNLHEILRRWNPAAGPDGFEGLVARALAELTGYTFRLARSGAQFGRDAATPKAPFSIAMEAKRYTDSVPLQELVGKATLAAGVLAEGIDLWVLAATVEISEPTQRQLEEILDDKGITLLTLDWTDTGLPPLAVLLAAVRPAVVAWATRLLNTKQLADLSAGLEDIARDPAFGASLSELQAQLSPALLGLDAFRSKNSEWCERNFASSKLAQRNFSQFLTPLEKPALIADRSNVQSAIKAAVDTATADVEGDSLVAVLGGDGAGKTWSVANWWLAAAPRPILMLSIGRIVDQLSGTEEAIEMLARLAAHQDSRRHAPTIARWRRRLERWSNGSLTPGRFIVLIDGLNETSGKPWAAILRTLMPAAHSLGGVVMATCREGYWDRDVANRLPDYVTVVPVHIQNYDDREFADVLGKNEVDPAALAPRLNQFMRNPRICALALRLLPQLSGIEELSIDRLLLEYWRHRLREREDLVGHNDEDFRDLLVRHAREYRERPGTDFDRNEWRSRSGASQRQDGRDLAHDLSDIEEGQFFDSLSRRYQFREETLHFALGLLVADELGAAVRDGVEDLDEALDSIIDPIRGFDTVGDILSAAIAVATLDGNYPNRGIAALVGGWMSLQNLGDEAFENLITYVVARPAPFIDAWEAKHSERDDGRFLQLLFQAAKRDSVAEAFKARLNRWLGTWSRRLPDYGGGPDRSRRQGEHEARVEARLAQMTESERRFLAEWCTELPESAGLASAAALFLYGRPLAEFASGIVAFAFAYTLTGNTQSPYEDLSWVVRLNRIDPAEVAAAVRSEIADLIRGEPSVHALEAAACALRLLGSLDAEQEAQAVSPRPDRVTYGNDRPDPLNPETEAPEGVAQLTERMAGLDAGQIWSGMWSTSEDHDLERNRELLIRFDPAGFRKILDTLARSVATRTDMPLRQLGWHIPWLSQVMSEEAVAATRQRIADISKNPALVPDGDENFVTGMLVEGVMPTLDAGQQLDLLQSLPTRAPYYFRYAALAKPLSGVEAAFRLDGVMDADPRILERTLLFLASSTTDVTDELREMVAKCLASHDAEVSAAAAEFARSRNDAGLDEALMALDAPPREDKSWRASVVRSAIASAIGRRGRNDLVEEVPVEHLDWVAARLPAARDRLADTIEKIIDDLVEPLDVDEPRDAIIVLEVGEDPSETRMNLVDRGEKRPDDPVAAIEALNEEMSDASGAKFANRRQLLSDQVDRFMASLMSEGAIAFARRPYSFGLAELASAQPERYAGWLRTILGTEDQRALCPLQNLGFALAQNYAEIDPDLAANVLAHLWAVESHLVVRVGDAKHEFRHLALFAAAASPEINGLRLDAYRSARDDREIECLTLAAVAAGANEWLDRFIDERLASDTAADHALAITTASFRPANAHSDTLLRRDWGRGFLGGAASAARARYERAAHAMHWFALAAAANDPHERWRFIELGIASADRRQLLAPSPHRAPEFRLIGGDIPQRLDKAAEKASGGAVKTFLGQRRPTNLID